LNELSLEDYLGRQRATAIYIVGGWDCLSFNTPPKTSTHFYLKPLLVLHH
jgi:hypothetical protein